jgi:hypothetical protein
MTRRFRFRLLGALLACATLPWPAAAQASTGATLTYRRVFKDSSPEYIEVRVSEGGACAYDVRMLSDEASLLPFEVGRPLLDKIFELAAQTNHFRGVQLDVRRRIANLGQKTFRYEKGGEVNEATFNYTTHPAAAQLVQIFEGLARQQEHLDRLQRRVRYDRLGVNDALLAFEADLNRKILPEPERLLPVLEQVAADERVLQIARHRARALIERLRSSK